MYLNNRQILSLLSPFLIAGVIYYFSDDIVKNLRYLFPQYESYKDTNLNAKAETYLKIEAKDKIYQKIQNDIKNRHLNTNYVAEKILYSKKTTWTLQMTYPKKNIAIINNKISKVNDIVDNAKIISIENSRVLIRHDERLQWLYLFN